MVIFIALIDSRVGLYVSLPSNMIVIKNKDFMGLLCLRAPLLFTHRANVDELEVHLIVFDIHDITLLGARIALACVIGAFNTCHVGQCGVELCEGIEKDLITLRRLLLEINLQNQSSLLVLLLIPTVLTESHQLIILLIQIEIESACGAEIRRFHNWFYYTLRVLPASILYVGTSDPQRRHAAIESDTGERFRPPVKIDRPKKGWQTV
jgi:hypothetical protein